MIEVFHLVLIRKPLDCKSVMLSLIQHGSGPLNIDKCRVAGPAWKWGTQTDLTGGGYGTKRPSDGHVMAKNVESNLSGRWPANIMFCHSFGCSEDCDLSCSVRILDSQSGALNGSFGASCFFKGFTND